ncbi:MarR family transcriptional regulator [Martelella alba]|uniref:MarR family transcriptional regulator n=1 Tax=Martelella alba TaxID=2590451 RepID=A0A506UF63_9HYPH|nr:MarR family transcriptional regulator [Martelella alba]TPW31851.1 MarR family transcriptional regulator [Martelella alba]
MEETDEFRIVELLFFAYRDFVSDPDVILAELGFGRAHHRVIHFVGRHPGMTVADLLDILKITKQSLARVLKQLIDMGYVRQAAGPSDRRQRRLYLTEKGERLRCTLVAPQLKRVEGAMEKLAPEDRETIFNFLDKMCDTTRQKC